MWRREGRARSRWRCKGKCEDVGLGKVGEIRALRHFFVAGRIYLLIKVEKADCKKDVIIYLLFISFFTHSSLCISIMDSVLLSF